MFVLMTAELGKLCLNTAILLKLGHQFSECFPLSKHWHFAKQQPDSSNRLPRTDKFIRELLP